MKPVSKIFILLLSSILLFGCTGLDKGVDPVSTAKSIEGIQQFLNEHPNARIVSQYLTQQQSVDLLKEYPECKYATAQPLYFVTFKDAQTYVAALVSIDQTPLCVITTTNADTNPIPDLGTVVNQATPTAPPNPSVPPVPTPPVATPTAQPSPTETVPPIPPLPDQTNPDTSNLVLPNKMAIWSGSARTLPTGVTRCNVGEVAVGLTSSGVLQCGTLETGLADTSSHSASGSCGVNEFVTATLENGRVGCTTFTRNGQPLQTSDAQKRDIALGETCRSNEALSSTTSPTTNGGTCVESVSSTTGDPSVPPLPGLPSQTPTANPTTAPTWTPTATPAATTNPMFQPTANPTASGGIPPIPALPPA